MVAFAKHPARTLAVCCVSFADPAPVASFRCEVVPKEPTLILKWACPPGTNTGFGLEISRGAWKNVTDLDSCSLENGPEYRTNVTYLNFSTSYNISITALSCNKSASPAQNTCLTGITGGLRGHPGNAEPAVCTCGLQIHMSF